MSEQLTSHPASEVIDDSKTMSDSEAISNAERLSFLEETALLDTPPEEAFDRLTTLASKILKAPVSLFSLVDEERQFFKSSTGLEQHWASQRETPLSHSFCQHVVASSEPLAITDAREHPLVFESLGIKELGVVAYLGMPLTVENHTLGSFCVIDHQPRQWTPEEIEILQDLTASAITEIEVRLVGQRLRESYRKLQESEALREQLTHMMVHDLRTPMTSFLGALQTMDEVGTLNPVQRELLEMSCEGGKRLLDMVGDLLDISKMEGGKMPLDYEEVRVSHLADSAQEQVASLATSEGLRLIRHIALDLPPLRADGVKLVRVLVNLLGNAIKFTHRGGTITLSARLPAHDQFIHFAVTDTGQGIAPEDQEHIFEMFGQVKTNQSQRFRSTGLGLTFCKMVVDEHGGSIWVQSAVGQGSTFHFTIPIDLKVR